ncbi:nuclear transport factor 2 family protein [Streptomyces acidiscabies]|uniref:Nuclear transport factor 2 family protein n=1 Tax=Streptomyces acidiscabies TaxID=42234 RepID=A0AAP6EHH6_9ACTN|nr:nuclear transport factor 2 family protein [Streptomyces acidiscabies]MBZ3909412.1 nuclear transport factor 2 family protein [Streptomyces acidiscabies]MDX2962421.1 nuclear transport factor 2 family protein [Streptomyces acidiscabies]MDX3792440.1 nuclear transport factor 2 family protein [Streptomyces acidiscabies]
MRIRATITATTAILTLTTLAACSSSDDGKAAPTTPSVSTPSSEPSPAEASTTPTSATGTAALEQAVTAYTAAYFKGDASAYDTLSKRCQGQIGKDAYAGVVQQAKADYGAQTVKSVTVDKIAGDLARVSYEVSLPKFSQAGQAWVREGAAWKYDAC